MAPSPKFHVYGLAELYPELGTYSFKIVLNPRYFKSGQDFEVVMVDSDRKPMMLEVKNWGRKLNVTFIINENTPDGVSVATITRNGADIGRLHFWTVIP
jgi:hypothetical protein